MIYFEGEIIHSEEVRVIMTGRDLNLKRDFVLSKDPYFHDWQVNALRTLKTMGCDEGICWRAINGRYDLDRGGARLLRRHLTIVGQMNLYERVWKLIK